MRCDNCNHVRSYFDGCEVVGYCEVLDISSEYLYNEDNDSYGCRFNRKAIESMYRKLQQDAT